MVILALDTTTRAGSVAVLQDHRLVSSVQGDGRLTHGERLPAEIALALERAALSVHDVGLLAVASGPGAFTGLRIGLAAVQGLAMVLNVPVIGVSSLDALAFATWPHIAHAQETTLWCWMDAQRGEVFAARYRWRGDDSDNWLPSEAPMVGAPAQLLSSIDPTPGMTVVVGDGAVRHQPTIEAVSGGTWRVMDPPDMLAPAIGAVGRRLAARGLAGPPHALQPLYVRRPDAELERERRVTP